MNMFKQKFPDGATFADLSYLHPRPKSREYDIILDLLDCAERFRHKDFELYKKQMQLLAERAKVYSEQEKEDAQLTPEDLASIRKEFKDHCS